MAEEHEGLSRYRAVATPAVVVLRAILIFGASPGRRSTTLFKRIRNM
jgi:hypothetical protein